MKDSLRSVWLSLTDRWERFGRYEHSTLLVWALGFGFLAGLPLVFAQTPFISVHILIITLVWATAAQSWNIMSGFTGQFSFGHAAFFGVGAYATQILLIEHSINPWIGMLVGAVVAFFYGLFIGFLCFRYDLRGHYFALATLAFAELTRHVVTNFETFGGSYGFFKPLARRYADGPGLVAFQFNTDLPYYYVILAFLLIVSLVAYLIRNSVIGLQMFAIRDNQDAAKSIGIPTYEFKMFAVGVSAFFTAWTGAFWSMYFSSIRPDTTFDILINVDVLLPAIVGGLGTVAGPIIGSFIVTPISQIARQSVGIHGMDNIVYGIVLVLFIIYTPRGAVGWPDRINEYFGVSDDGDDAEAAD